MKKKNVLLTVLLLFMSAFVCQKAFAELPSGDLSYLDEYGFGDFGQDVFASSVAAQLGGYAVQLNSYDQAFQNMDMYMLMTKKQRNILKSRQKEGKSYTSTIYDNAALWARPYAEFENVTFNNSWGYGLKNYPKKVSNVMWGSYFGGDSELIDLGNGWDGMFSVYAGYNGSHQAFDGVGVYQNGATLGVAGMAYKDNYFAGATINVGSNIADAEYDAYDMKDMGKEDFNMLMSGIAAKTGYNWELVDGKFIVQPSYLMSYSFINTFDYNNAFGQRVTSDPLQALQLQPQVKLIGNFNNGWQPYAHAGVVWTLLDRTNFQVASVDIPSLSIKPYAKYGFGVRKTFGERVTGFFQTFFTNGGRNGVGLQAGIRWTLGKSVVPKVANSTGEKKYIAKK